MSIREAQIGRAQMGGPNRGDPKCGREPKRRLVGRRQPQYVATGIFSFDILVIVFLGADQRAAGNVDGSSGPPGLNPHPKFVLFSIIFF